MVCHLFSTNPSPKLMMLYELDPKTSSTENCIKIQRFSFEKMHLKMLSLYKMAATLFQLQHVQILSLHINSLWPIYVIWRQGSRSTLGQVMASCLMAPSHYLNQCWLMISEVLWHSPDSNFTENTQDIYHWNEFEIYLFETVVKSPRGQWVKPAGAAAIIFQANQANSSPWTKWPPFCRRYIQMHFREWKVWVFLSKFQWSLFLRVQLIISQYWFR